MVNHSVAPMARVVEASPVLGNEDAVMGRAPVQCLVRPVGACLLRHWKAWRNMGADKRVVSVLRYGFTLRFVQFCPTIYKPGFSRLPADPEKLAVLDAEVRQMALKEAIEIAPKGQKGFFSHLFLVPKPGGKWRPIIDLKALNKLIHIPTFRMETPEVIRAQMRPGDWAISIDLSDAYFHIPIKPRFRPYLSFCHRGQTWQFRALPFGLSTAPWIFTRVMLEVKKMAAMRGILIHMYIDDWLIRAQSPEVLTSHGKWVLHLCAKLGLRVNLQKSELKPAQEFTFLGYRFNTVLHRVYPPQKRLDKLLPVLDSFNTTVSHTAHQWESLLGLLASTEKLVPLGRCHMRALQQCLAAQWDCVTQSPLAIVDVNQEAIKDIRWWLDPGILQAGVPTHQLPHDLQIFTDSSATGWGAHCLDETVSGIWTLSESLLHINNLELLAVSRAVHHWSKLVTNRSVLVVTDNTTVMAYINKQGGTRSLSLSREVTRMLVFCFSLGAGIRA